MDPGANRSTIGSQESTCVEPIVRVVEQRWTGDTYGRNSAETGQLLLDLAQHNEGFYQRFAPAKKKEAA